MAGGLAWDEVEAVLRAAAGGRRMAGMSIAIFDLLLDTAGTLAERPAALLGRAPA